MRTVVLFKIGLRFGFSMKKTRIYKKNTGFTLTEMCVVLAVAAVISSIAIPKLSYTIRRESERQTINKMELIEKAVDKYWAEHDGEYPDSLNELISMSGATGGTYLKSIPYAHRPPYHEPSNHVTNVSEFIALVDGGMTEDEAIEALDDGGWVYVEIFLDTDTPKGVVGVMCNHPDVDGRNWLD
ncbi:type II secretion system protein [Elusimicrobiota bacterium]